MLGPTLPTADLHDEVVDGTMLLIAGGETLLLSDLRPLVPRPDSSVVPPAGVVVVAGVGKNGLDC